MTWVSKIFQDLKLTNDTTYAEKLLHLETLTDNLQQEPSSVELYPVFSTLRHVLVLAVDRLDYETLHLKWLP